LRVYRDARLNALSARTLTFPLVGSTRWAALSRMLAISMSRACVNRLSVDEGSWAANRNSKAIVSNSTVVGWPMKPRLRLARENVTAPETLHGKPMGMHGLRSGARAVGRRTVP
jgi:hypothetical protein